MNCVECGKIFNKIYRNYCPNCEKTIEEYCVLVSDYLYDKGKSSIAEIHADTGVSIKWIEQMIAQGRIEQTLLNVKCEICNNPIAFGKICDKCRNKMISGITVEKKDKSPSFYIKKRGMQDDDNDDE